MTRGETLYLMLALVTFASFAFGVGIASLRQTQLDSKAARREREFRAQGMQPAE